MLLKDRNYYVCAGVDMLPELAGFSNTINNVAYVLFGFAVLGSNFPKSIVFRHIYLVYGLRSGIHSITVYSHHNAYNNAK